MRVAAAAVAKKLLRERWGVGIVGYVKSIGDIEGRIDDPAAVTLEQVESNPVRCPDQEAAARMAELIERMRSERDSVGRHLRIRRHRRAAGLGRAACSTS